MPSSPRNIDTHLPTQVREYGKYLVAARCLGRGSFGEVHLAFHIPSQAAVACKRIAYKTKSDLNEAIKEAELYRTLNHVIYRFLSKSPIEIFTDALVQVHIIQIFGGTIFDGSV
jgi:serine/threonine protein kinase